MSPSKRETRIQKTKPGETAADYLAARFTYQSRAQWLAHASEGRLELNGKPCIGLETVKVGDRIAFDPPPIVEPFVNENWSVILEDDSFVFVNKPAGLPSHPSGIYRTRTLWNFLMPTYGALHLINRLDRETSGIVVAAKTGEDASEAARAMSEGRWEKCYRVVVEGEITESIDAAGWLVSDGNSPVRKKLAFVRESPGEPAPEGGMPVRTRFHPLRFQGDLSELRAELLTGKTHQIRATLQGLGFPVTGDKLYGKDPTAFLRFMDDALTDEDRSLLRMDRQALHCERIAFSLGDGKRYEAIAPLPGDWPFPG